MNSFCWKIFGTCLFLLFVGFGAGCADDGSETQDQPESGIQLPEEFRSLVVPSEEGQIEFYFRAEGIWKASVSEPADQWCIVVPTKGGSGTAWIQVRFAQNTSVEERNAVIMLQCGDQIRTVDVAQKGMDCLTLTRSQFELGREGGVVDVEVEANIAFEYEVEVECRDWIREETTRSMQTTALRFRVDPYKGGPVRQGAIRIAGGGKTETIRIYQEGTDPAIVLSQDEYVLPHEATTVRVDLLSNVEFEVQMPEVEWIRDVSSRVLSAHTHFFEIAENPSEEDRSAEVRYTDRVTGYSKSVRILQKGRSVAVVAKDEYEVPLSGGFVTFAVRYNNGCVVSIPDDVYWIERIYRMMPRSMQEEEVILKVGPTDASRKATVAITDAEGNSLASIRIFQNDNLLLVLSERESVVSWKGGDVRVELRPDMLFSYEIYEKAADWLRYVETVGNVARFRIEPNYSDKHRTGMVEFFPKATKISDEVFIRQMPENSLALAKDTYVVPNEGGGVEVSLDSYASFKVDISEEWVQRVDKSTRRQELLSFKVAPNPSDKYRAATVTFVPDDGTATQKFTIYQIPEDEIVIPQRDVTIPSTGGGAWVEILGSADYAVTASADWVLWSQKSDPKRMLLIMSYPFESDTSREAEVVVKNLVTGEEQTIQVTQLQKNTLVVAQPSYLVKPEGGTLAFDVQTNVPLEVGIDPEAQSWLTHIETRALEPRTLRFEVAAGSEEREGVITIRGGGIAQVVSVLQSANEDYDARERQALNALFDATGGSKWPKRGYWGSDQPLDRWYGVTCTNGRVTSIQLPNNGLMGSLPAALGNLTALETIDLHNNGITGPLPDVFGRMKKLKTLRIDGNGMGGDLPPSLGELEQLIHLDISKNAFTGRLPDSFVNLGALEIFRASEAGLVGGIGVVPEGSPNLRILDLSSNGFTGEIPEAMYNLTKLSELDLHGNPISGPIASALGNLHSLTELNLSSTRIAGDIPSSIGILQKLLNLDLHDAQMSGSLPESMGELTQLVTLRLENNRFSGTVPESLMQHRRWAQFWGSVLDQRGPGLSTGVVPLPGPSFSSYDLNGKLVHSGFVYVQNELTVLFQWELNNLECARLMSDLIPVYRDLKQYGLEIVGYAYDQGEEVSSYVNQMHIYWPTVHVNAATGANNIFRTSVFPTITMVDRYERTVFCSLIDDIDDAVAFIRKRFEQFTPYESTDYTSDGKVDQLQRATEGAGIDIVLMGDAFSDREIEDGSYDRAMQRAMGHFFSIEPYKSFRNYFNVYSVKVVSKNEGYFTGAENALGSFFKGSSTIGGDSKLCRKYALRVPGMTEEKLDNTLVIALMNSDRYGGISYLTYSDKSPYGSGFAACYFPLGSDQNTFAELLHHEAGGHGFAKLGDEYSTGAGPIPQSVSDQIRAWSAYGWWRNIDLTSDPSAVKWSHFLMDNRYANEGLGVFQGGYAYGSGVFRPTSNSIMNDNKGGFNAPSREAIYMRIMWLAHGPNWKYNYEEFVKWDARNRKRQASVPERASDRRYVPLPPPVVIDSPSVRH